MAYELQHFHHGTWEQLWHFWPRGQSRSWTWTPTCTRIIKLQSIYQVPAASHTHSINVGLVHCTTQLEVRIQRGFRQWLSTLCCHNLLSCIWYLYSPASGVWKFEVSWGARGWVDNENNSQSQNSNISNNTEQNLIYRVREQSISWDIRVWEKHNEKMYTW